MAEVLHQTRMVDADGLLDDHDRSFEHRTSLGRIPFQRELATLQRDQVAAVEAFAIDRLTDALGSHDRTTRVGEPAVVLKYLGFDCKRLRDLRVVLRNRSLFDRQRPTNGLE